jgi:DNA-directed RNA polymerase II subunit RPB1
MSLYKELSYDHDFDQIKGIQFCVMSPDEIQKRSVAEITKSETFNGNEPVYNGLFDPRMGVIDHNKVCVTCKQKNTFCPGHFGHINLAKPIFYVHFFETVRKTLKCVCFRCSKLLVDPNNADVKALEAKKLSRQKRWDAMCKLSAKEKKCPQCSAKQPAITKEGMLKISLEWKEKENSEKLVLHAEEVLQILSRITDHDAELLGFHPKYNRPEWMICTVLPVPPPAVRPSVRTETGQRQEDDLTHKLLGIVKMNRGLQQKIEKQTDKSANEQIDMLTMLLQYEAATMIDNTNPSLPVAEQKTGRPIRSLTERLKSKDGRIRGNLMGKRVDFSARSVITPDPNISIEELGVPIKIAMNMTFPEIVTKYNMEEMYKLVRNGPDVYPGAKFIKKANTGAKKRLKYFDRNSIILEEGDTVERHMRNGDYILFNRQPSLHKMSMLGHKVRVMPYNTFRLNVLITPAYNADFDGDEMNLHLPQSRQTMEELRQLAAVSTQILSPRDCTPIVSVVQDVCLGLYRLTKSYIKISERQFFNLLMTNSYFDGVLPESSGHDGLQKFYSGRKLLSMIMPKRLNIEMKGSQYDENKTKEENKEHIISIRNGEILSGAFDKSVYQSRTKGIIHSTYSEYGAKETQKLFDHTQKLICDWLVYSGFSVGVSDLVVDQQTSVEFKNIIHNMKIGVYDIIKKIHEGNFENNSTYNNNDMFESQVNAILNEANKKVGAQGLKDIRDENNRLINMVKSKSKGQPINVAQMIGCVGQQNVDGRRIPYGFEDRTLPHYSKYDDGPESRGFVENSFINGLTPQEFFFHAMGGREGLIDTACNTSEIGYIQRKLVKAMEDAKVNYDMTVRNAAGVIIQYLYGEDGMDACKLETQYIYYIDMEPDQIRAMFGLVDGINDFKTLVNNTIFNDLQKKKDVIQQRMDKHLKMVFDDRDHLITNVFRGESESSLLYPISFYRMITCVQNMYDAVGAGVPHDLSPEYILDTIDKLCTELYVTNVYKGNHLLQCLIRCYLSPKRIIGIHRLTKNGFDAVVDQVRGRFYESMVHPSEMVGVVAAQSIGEPATQLVLNTFHSAGISSASQAVRGVPRLNELLSVSKNIKAPIMRIHFHPSFSSDKKKCMEVMNTVRTVRFKDVVTTSSIYYDPSNATTNIEEDKGLIDIYNKFAKLESEKCQKTSPWLLRLEVNRNKLLEYGLDMITLHHTLDNFYDEVITCVFSDDNADKLVMRIALTNVDGDTDDALTNLKALEHNILENLVIKGVKNVERVALDEKRRKIYNNITKVFDQRSEWIMYTLGTNLRDILIHPMVNAPHSVTNDINEIYEVLGIEAARNALYNEIMDVMTGVNVNYRHISLLIDVMTNRGTLLSVNRHGINRGDIGPLAKCSFEETTDKLIKAGIFAELDKINGVSANVMLGQIAPCGTGDVEVVIDEDIMKLLPTVYEESDNEEDIEAGCTDDAFRIAIPEASTSQHSRKVNNDLVLFD